MKKEVKWAEQREVVKISNSCVFVKTIAEVSKQNPSPSGQRAGTKKSLISPQ